MEYVDAFAESDAVHDLRTRARTARAEAVTPRSGYAVGAAVETADGTTYAGANRELPDDAGDVSAPEVARATDLAPEVAAAAADLASPEATNLHAEVVALARATADDAGPVERVAVSTGERDARPPCETCRPVLRDHAASEGVAVVTSAGGWAGRTFTLAELEADGDLLDALDWRSGGEVATSLGSGDVVTPDGEVRRLGDLLAARTARDEGASERPAEEGRDDEGVTGER